VVERIPRREALSTNQSMIKLALISEDFSGEIAGFLTEAEAQAFAGGYARGGDAYGAGHCAAYTLVEAQELLADATRDVATHPESTYSKRDMKMWAEVVDALL